MAMKLTLYFFAPGLDPCVQCLIIEPDARIPEVARIIAANFTSLSEIQARKLRLFKVGHLSLVAIRDRHHMIIRR
jgi:hypothetical protein